MREYADVIRTIPPFMVLLLAPLTLADDRTDPANRDTHLRVMSFNIEWGGTHVSFDKVVEAIERSGADVVGIQEAEGNLERLADALDWHYDRRNYLVSRFPVLDPPGAAGRYALIEAEPGRVAAIANVHLPSDPYGPDAVKSGASTAEVIELERSTRLPAIEPVLEAIAPIVAGGVPVFVTGDFNAPSHRDWTDGTIGRRRFLTRTIDWPVSRAMESAGFTDAFRSVHPDPVRNPGLTWWAARPPLAAYAPGESDPRDRIDFIWFAGPVTAESAGLVGEEGAPEVSLGLVPWPSDHRAVLAAFDVRLAKMPRLVTTNDRVYREGADVRIEWNTRSGRLRVQHLDEGDIVHGQPVSGRGSVAVPAKALAPGRYRVVVSGGSDPPLVREFRVLESGATPVVRVTADRVAVGDGIRVRWRNAPGNRNDYIAVHPAGSSPDAAAALPWIYLDAEAEGERIVDADSAASGWPLPPGRYVMHLLKDDGYESLATSGEFEIYAPGDGP